MSSLEFSCSHASHIVDSNGITEHLVAFEVSRDEMKKFYDWKEKGDVMKIKITDDSGLFASNSSYRCVKVLYDYGHAVIELERE